MRLNLFVSRNPQLPAKSLQFSPVNVIGKSMKNPCQKPVDFTLSVVPNFEVTLGKVSIKLSLTFKDARRL